MTSSTTASATPALDVDQLHVPADAIQALQHDLARGGSWWHEYDDDAMTDPAGHQQLVTEVEAAINPVISTARLASDHAATQQERL